MKRDSVLDIARAMASIGIVSDHVTRGLAAAGMMPYDSMFTTFDLGMYIWRLPVFAFTAGLFVPRGVEREGGSAFLARRLSGFVWLYLLWTFIQDALRLAGRDYVNAPGSWVEMLAIWRPQGQLWFLGWLAAVTLFVALVRPWTTSTRAASALAASAVISAATWGYLGSFFGLQALSLSCFFVVAATLGWKPFSSALRRTRMPALVIAGSVVLAASMTVSALGIATPATTGWDARTFSSVALGIVAATASVGAVLALSQAISRCRPLARPLAFVGRHTLAIFVSHMLFTAGARIVLTHVGLRQPGLHLACGVVAGVAGPLVLWKVSRHPRLQWLLQSPGWLSTRVGPNARQAVLHGSGDRVGESRGRLGMAARKIEGPE